jgi:hypothetical protein
MKLAVTIIGIFLVQSLSAQLPVGGHYSEMETKKVKSIKEYSVYLYGEIPDTNWLNTKQYNKQGYLIREEFMGYLKQKCYYQFEYNSNGFIVNIDSTSNNLNYSRGGYNQSIDTVLNTEKIIWEHLPNGSKREKLRESIWYDDMIGDSTIQVLEYTYTSFGELETIVNRSQDFDGMRKSVSFGKYIYNDKELISEVVILDSNDNIIVKSFYLYEYY